MSDEALAVPIAVVTEPRFFDTYALVYAFILTFLVPGLAVMSTLPFRTYTFQYVSAFAGPFVLGLLATFFTDSSDPWPRVVLRSAIMVPLVILTGVTVLFAGSLSVLPVSSFLKPANGAVTTPIMVVLLAALAAPLVFALARRLRRRPDWRGVAQILALVIALGVAAWVRAQGPHHLRDRCGDVVPALIRHCRRSVARSGPGIASRTVQGRGATGSSVRPAW